MLWNDQELCQAFRRIDVKKVDIWVLTIEFFHSVKVLPVYLNRFDLTLIN